MVGSIGMRRDFINRGDWPDGLERQGSNPWPTTTSLQGEQSWGRDSYYNGWNFSSIYSQKFKIGDPVMDSDKTGKIRVRNSTG